MHFLSVSFLRPLLIDLRDMLHATNKSIKISSSIKVRESATCQGMIVLQVHRRKPSNKALIQVTPVLGRIASMAKVQPNPAEVDAVFDVSLATFLSANPDVYSFVDSNKAFGNGMSYRIHFFQCGEHCVWGLTAGILIEAARQALGREPEFETKTGEREYTEIIYDDDRKTVVYRQKPSL